MPIIFTCSAMIGRNSTACLAASFSRRSTPREFPASGGYQPLDKEPFLKNTLESRGFQAIYGPDGISDYLEKTHCPANDQLCEVAVWLTQTTLLGPRRTWTEIARRSARCRSTGPSWRRREVNRERPACVDDIPSRARMDPR